MDDLWVRRAGVLRRLRAPTTTVGDLPELLHKQVRVAGVFVRQVAPGAGGGEGGVCVQSSVAQSD